MSRSAIGCALLWASVSLFSLAGCTGRGSVAMVPFMRSDLQPQEVLVQRVPINEAYYSVDDQGEITVALRYHAKSLLNKTFDVDWQMSIVLGSLPAGSQKLYRMSNRTGRIAQSHMSNSRRGESLTGIVVLHAPKNGRLKGRFHANMRLQQFGVLTGWSPALYRAPMVITVGEFEAIENFERAQQIRAHTEPEGLERTLKRSDKQSTAPSRAATTVPGG